MSGSGDLKWLIFADILETQRLSRFGGARVPGVVTLARHLHIRLAYRTPESGLKSDIAPCPKSANRRRRKCKRPPTGRPLIVVFRRATLKRPGDRSNAML